MTKIIMPEIMQNNSKLYLGDCQDILPALESNSVDAVITDPPFGIKFKYATHDDSPEGYGKWLWNIIEQCERIARPGAPIFVWQAMPNIRRLAEWFPRDFRLFAACKSFVMIRPTPMQYAWDPVVVWWKEGETEKRVDNKNIGIGRDWHIASSHLAVLKTKSLARKHPCPRPRDQIKYVVEQWVKPKGIILDPFIGSGTTGVVAVETGRSFIGMEKDPAYYDIAKQRINETYKDLGLF